jgi:hypothetical protein
MKMEKVSATFSVIMIPFMPGCEECMADQLNLDSGCRQMKGTQISNTRRQGKHPGLRTDKTQHGWQQR